MQNPFKVKAKNYQRLTGGALQKSGINLPFNGLSINKFSSMTNTSAAIVAEKFDARKTL
ncbi:MAG: hypothetical protein SR3Q1_01265 [Quinella sp. 3Q1]|nr:hypothetical protein [Quinella sp. 3Q1]MBR3050615.1 hypothetical protein [Selenomonadaceae bacterium]MBR6888785.1 hypothetical protein [Selenomonadaceae bacterium]